MTTWAVVPLKPFAYGKSRLSSVLAPAARADLSRRLLTRTLKVLGETPGIVRTLVISRDLAVLALARHSGALTMTESGTGLLNLNVALGRATHIARSFGAKAVLVLPSDLPLVTSADVSQLLEADGPDPAVVIAPDRHATGTNALFLRPPDLLNFVFGADSFHAHLVQARTLRVEPRICHLPNVALDLDTPEDLALLGDAALSGPPEI